MARSTQAFVGRRRIDAFVSPSEAGYTRAVRSSMRQVVENFKRIVAGIENASPDALAHAVAPIFEESQRLVPVDTGALRNSGFVESGFARGGEAFVVVGYAKAGRPSYAALVHERVDVHHKSPTQAKFLEEAMNRGLDQILSRYVSFVRGATGLS